MDIVYPDKYFSKVKEEFPELSEKQIKDIIYYGVRMMFMMTYYGVDLHLQRLKFFVYIGELFNNPDRTNRYRKARLSKKYRVLYNREKKPFSGKYYFCVPKEIYEKMPKKKKGGVFPLESIYGFKIPEEAMLQGGQYLYEFDWPENKGYGHMFDTSEIGHYRLYAVKDSNNKFIPVSAEEKQKPVKRSQKKGDK